MNCEAKGTASHAAHGIGDNAIYKMAPILLELQELHKIWKEDIGPVAKEMREDVWEKFSAVTKKIHDKRHDYYRDMKSQYDDIIEEKLLIINEIANYDSSKNNFQKDNNWLDSASISHSFFKS